MSVDMPIRIQVSMLHHGIKINSSNIPEEEKADNIAQGKILFLFPTVLWVRPDQVIY